MRRNNQRPLSFTSRQVQQLKWISDTLRQLNCTARRELRRIEYTDLTRTQYREAGDLFGTIAMRMISALRYHDAILKAEQEPQPLRIITVHFVEPCVHNRSESRQLTDHDHDAAEREAPKQDPAHWAEIESLLDLTNSIEDLVSRRSMLRGVLLHAFFRGINRFRSAVLQQQQYVLAASPQLFEFEVADGPDVCPDCLK